MHPRIEEIIRYTKEQFQLADFYLESSVLMRHDDQIVLSMDWLQNGTTRDETNSIPAGAVNFSVDIDTNKLTAIHFTGGENHLPDNLFPQVDNLEAVIEWVEEKTHLDYGRQFKLVNEEKDNITFYAAVDNLTIFPGGTIHLSFNEEGILSSFHISGQFAEESELEWEPFNITEDAVRPLAKQYCKLIEFPDEATDTWKPIYITSSFLLKNQNPDTVTSFDEVENNLSYTLVNTPLVWQEASQKQFEEKEIHIPYTLTEEEAFQHLNEDDENIAIPNDAVEKITREIIEMLRMEFPDDSGLWCLTSLKREKGYILARLNPSEASSKVFYRSLTLWINPMTLKVDNYLDSKPLLEAFDSFEESAPPKVDRETASAILVQHIELQPVYVYNRRTKKYELYGKLHCDYGVDALTGELSPLNA